MFCKCKLFSENQAFYTGSTHGQRIKKEGGINKKVKGLLITICNSVK